MLDSSESDDIDLAPLQQLVEQREQSGWDEEFLTLKVWRASAGDRSPNCPSGEQAIECVLAELIDDDRAGPSPERKELGVALVVGKVEPLVTTMCRSAATSESSSDPAPRRVAESV